MFKKPGVDVKSRTVRVREKEETWRTPGTPAGVDEEMEEVEEGEEDSISNVWMDTGQWTFIVDTGVSTVETGRSDLEEEKYCDSEGGHIYKRILDMVIRETRSSISFGG